jgi:hypothetical protein
MFREIITFYAENKTQQKTRMSGKKFAVFNNKAKGAKTYTSVP